MSAGEVVANDSKIVKASVRELGTAGAFADRPDIRCCCLEAIIHRYVAARIQLNSGRFQADSGGVRGAARCDQNVAAGNGRFARASANHQVDTGTGTTTHAEDLCRDHNINSFLGEETRHFVRHVRIRVGEKLSCVMENRYFASETAVSLGKFETDVAAADHDEVFGSPVKL